MAAAAIIVENGSIVIDANSYASVTMLRQYADNHGIKTIPTDDTAAAVLLFRAMSYIEAKEPQFSGIRACLLLPSIGTMYPVPQTQPLSWPRYGAYDGNSALIATVIPMCLLTAQCQLACDASTGIDLMPTVVGTGNIKVKVRGPIRDEYFAPQQGGSTAQFTAANAALRRLYVSGGALRTTRA